MTEQQEQEKRSARIMELYNQLTESEKQMIIERVKKMLSEKADKKKRGK